MWPTGSPHRTSTKHANSLVASLSLSRLLAPCPSSIKYLQVSLYILCTNANTNADTNITNALFLTTKWLFVVGIQVEVSISQTFILDSIMSQFWTAIMSACHAVTTCELVPAWTAIWAKGALRRNGFHVIFWRSKMITLQEILVRSTYKRDILVTSFFCLFDSAVFCLEKRLHALL